MGSYPRKWGGIQDGWLKPGAYSYLIEPYNKNRALGSVGLAGQFFRSLAVIVSHSHADPPIAHRTAKAQRFGIVVAPRDMLRELGR